MIGGGEPIELVSAPAVADVQRMIMARPHYLRGETIVVHPELWHEARDQLRAALEARGWYLVEMTTKEPSFMLMGTPVVMSNG